MGATTDAGVRAALATASWIAPAEQDVPPAGQRPAYLLRGRFTASVGTSARLAATAHGIYELFLNGVRVGAGPPPLSEPR